MPKWPKIIIGVTIFIELLAIFFLARIIRIKLSSENNILGISVTPLKKENFLFPQDSELKYFYEPKPDTTQTEERTWFNSDITYTINSDALNERYNYSIEKPPDTFRIIALGDSFTFGSLVNTRDTWPEKLEDLLNEHTGCKQQQKFEVINLGVGGYDVAYIAQRYKARGQKYSPDLILWLESGTGFENINELIIPRMTKYAKDRDLGFKQYEIKEDDYYPIATQALNDIKKIYGEDTLLTQIRGAWNDFFEMRGDIPILIAPLLSIPKERVTLLDSWIQNYKNITIYNELPDIYSLRVVFPDGHPTAEGQLLIAKSMYAYINNSNLIPCILSSQ